MSVGESALERQKSQQGSAGKQATPLVDREENELTGRMIYPYDSSHRTKATLRCRRDKIGVNVVRTRWCYRFLVEEPDPGLGLTVPWMHMSVMQCISKRMCCQKHTVVS